MRNRLSAVALASVLALTGVACTDDAEDSLEEEAPLEEVPLEEEAPLEEGTE